MGFLMQKAFSGNALSPPPATVCLVLTDNAGIQEFKLIVFGLRQATDVLSVAYDAMPGERAGSADIVVNVERALEFVGTVKEGKAVGTGKLAQASYELALYVAHGCDHLSGKDDDTPANRAFMRKRELRWRAQAARLGLVSELLLPPRVFRSGKTGSHD
jgi:ssRNA-specific RNase YbeY (16S rRNA maturation enzyme)